MDPALAQALARLTLYVHFLVVVFNIGGLAIIPLGKIFDWAFVRVYWWRALHVFSMFLVAAQAALGQYCFLTLIESALTRAGAIASEPFWLDKIVRSAVFWPLPLSVFVPLYLVALALTILCWVWVRPGKRKSATRRE